MKTRREVLLRLFQLLDERHIGYCVMRNYAELFESTTSDVDLLTLRSSAPDVIQCCKKAAELTGHKLVQQTRFVNHSLVFWNGADDFVRIDIDTEKRWRLFHLLTAAEILRERQRVGDFYIPHPKHESVILLTQMLWRGQLSDRYAAQLQRLGEKIPDTNSLCTVFKQAFGLRENLPDRLRDTTLPLRLKRKIYLNTICRPANALHSLRYFFADLARLFVRLKSPPGIALRIATAGDFDSEKLIERLRILFPKQKACIDPKSRMSAMKALFKGGLVIQVRKAANDAGLTAIESWLGRASHPLRAFAAMIEGDGKLHAAHLASGSMAAPDSPLDAFICETLARQLSPPRKHGEGAFIVIVGLDGAGKTTFARNICALAAESARFRSVRYFHWIPPLFGPRRFPFPAFRETPRKKATRCSLTNTALSVLRLLKNVTLANLSYCAHIAPPVRQGELVLVDRFFYNYWLDPASVRYAGPAWLLAAARRFFPRQDAVVILRADATTLLSRKRELSVEEIQHQTALLDCLPVRAAQRIELDAKQLPEVLARQLLDRL